MPYPVAFIEIQGAFARRMAELTAQPYPDVVLSQTALYRILGLDWSLNPQHPVWRQFVTALGDDGAGAAAAYQIYSERCAQGLIPDYDTSRPHWGCFSYEYDANERAIRLHFVNLDTSGVGPLSSARRETRLAELREMFAHIHQAHPDAERAQGGSWLYNRSEYTRLFPPQYGESARADHPHLIARGLWGQFLRHGNRMNEELVTLFLARLAELGDAETYATCFPYQSLLTEAPIAAFYAFYGIEDQG